MEFGLVEKHGYPVNGEKIYIYWETLQVERSLQVVCSEEEMRVSTWSGIATRKTPPHSTATAEQQKKWETVVSDLYFEEFRSTTSMFIKSFDVCRNVCLKWTIEYLKIV